MPHSPLNPQKILVTGGAGFIGSCFVAQCVARGQDVLVLDALTYAGHRENLEWIQNPAATGGSWRLVQGNIQDGALVQQWLQDFQPDAVVSFAAESHVDNSIASPAEFIYTNVIGTYTMLEAARSYWNALQGTAKETFRYLQISTDEIYGSLELDSAERFRETSQIKPSSPYSASKAAGDHLVAAWYHTYGLPTIITNCTNNYGPRQYPEKLIPLMIQQALAGKPLPVYGDGLNVRDWIHVEDHCQGVYLALTKGKIGENYCFGGNAEKQNIEVVNTLCQVLEKIQPSKRAGGYAALITFVTDRLGHDRRYAMDDSKALHELGYTRHYDFETGLKQTVEWYLSNTKWCAAVTK
jgi:dTDP-glucose 4,6-dehydratase